MFSIFMKSYQYKCEYQMYTKYDFLMRILNCNKPYFLSLLHWFFIVLNLIFLVVEDQLWCRAVETKHWEKILLMCLDPSRYWINYICYWYFILANYYLLVDVDIYRFLVYVGFKLLSLKFYKCKLICLWRCKVLWSSRNMTQVKKLWMSSISSSLKISGIASGLLYNYSESFTNLAVIYSIIIKLSFLYI